MTVRLAFAAALLVAFAGCRSEVPGVSCATDAECPVGARCRDGVCVHEEVSGGGFEALTLDAPAAGDVHNPVSVAATLKPRDGSTTEPPPTIELTAQPASGPAEVTMLPLASGTTYSGPVTLARGGAYTLTARSPELSLASPDVSVFNLDCPAACPGQTRCERGACVSPFAGLAITAPVAGVVGPSVPVTVALTRRPNAAGATPPASVTVTASPASGPAETLTANLTANDTYAASWTPAAPHGTGYTLVASESVNNLASPAVLVTLDKQGPVLVARLPAITRQNAGDLTVLDPAMPAAFRRDESVTVRVETTDKDLDPTSVSVTLTLGAAAGTGTLTVPAAPATGCAPGATGCFAAELKLYDPALALKAFDATVPLTVGGKDKVGNVATAGATSATAVGITRFKWVFAPAQLGSVGVPALATRGRVVFAGAQAPGQAFALNPDGTRAWADPFTAANGAFSAAPVVGKVDGATYVFLAPTAADPTAGSELWALDIEKPTTSAIRICALGAGELGIAGQLAFAAPGVLGSGTGGPVPVVVGLSRTVLGADLFSARLATGAGGLSATCATHASLVSDVSAHTGAVVRAGEVYFGDDDGNLHGYAWDDTNKKFTTKGAGWPVALGSPSALVSNPVLDMTGAYVTKADTFFVVPFNSATPVSSTAAGAPTLGDPILPGSSQVVAGATDGALHVAPTAMNSQAILGASSGSIQAAPALGADGLLYVLSGKTLTAHALNGGAKVWAVDTNAGSSSAPLLDCARDASGAVVPNRPGVAYFGTDDGKLWAVIVDSAGQSTSAPWPRFHRDPGNTGDATVVLADSVCR